MRIISRSSITKKGIVGAAAALIALSLGGQSALAANVDSCGHNMLKPSMIKAQCNSGIARCISQDIRKVGTYMTKPVRVTKVYQNCTKADQTIVLNRKYSNTTTEGFSVGGQVKAPLAKGIEATIQASYNKSWTSTVENVEEKRLVVPSNKKIWIEVSAKKDRIIANLRTSYTTPVNGHYYWTLPNQEFAVPPLDGTPQEIVTIKTAPAQCNLGTGDITPEPSVIL